MKTEYNKILAEKIISAACLFQKAITRNDFQKIFEETSLEKNFYYIKWIEGGRKFIPLYTEMPQCHQKAITKYILVDSGQEGSDYLQLFFLYTQKWEYDANFWEIVFSEQGKYVEQLKKDKIKLLYISPENVCKFYLSLEESEREKVLDYIFLKFDPHFFENRERERRRIAFIEEQILYGEEDIILPSELLPISSKLDKSRFRKL